jgi:hypothetical protein
MQQHVWTRAAGETMRRRLLVILTLALTGVTMNASLHAQTNNAPDAIKQPVVFACDMKAMTPVQRKRHSEVLSPALKAAKLKTSELPDGYAFQFPSDAKTFTTVSEWIGNERLCCPFFEFDIHVGDSSAPMTLRITGPEGVKQFIRAELSGMVG